MIERKEFLLKKLSPEHAETFSRLDVDTQFFVTAVVEGEKPWSAYIEFINGRKTKASAEKLAAEILSDKAINALVESVTSAEDDGDIMTRKEALRRLTRFGRASISKIAELTNVEMVDANGLSFNSLNVSLKDSTNLTDDDISIISEITAKNGAFKVKIHSPLSAIEQIRKMEGWDNDKPMLNDDVARMLGLLISSRPS